MPTADDIVASLGAVATGWRLLAIAWHVYVATLVWALVAGVRPSRRVAGVLLAVPLLSVSALAWIHANPFNATLFALAGVVLLVIASRLGAGRIAVGPPGLIAPAALMMGFGWVYPHFLVDATLIDYLYAAPTGLIPCPTLAVVIGFSLLLRGLGSRVWCAVLAAVGVFYGVFGAVHLGVRIDWVLVAGAAGIGYVALSSAVVRTDAASRAR